MMETLWYCLIALMIAAYVILDGFDLGAGIIHLAVAKTDEERQTVLNSIEPFLHGNEVWLLAAGGTLFMAFPVLYASSFQGFYLPLMIVLWLLMARGLSIELRHHLDGPMWRPLLDVAFNAASVGLAIVFGAALGNVVRGVPLDELHEFFLAFWTDGSPGANPGILDWFTVLSGVAALAALSLHGALWVNYKTTGFVQERSARLASRLFLPVSVASAALSAAAFIVQPHVLQRFRQQPLGLVFPLLAIAALSFAWRAARSQYELQAFLGSCAFLSAMLSSAVFGLFPYVLPSSSGQPGLTIFNAATGSYGLEVGLLWWLPGLALTIAYSCFLYRRFSGKVLREEQVS